MSTSSAGRAVSSNGCVTRPKGRENGLHSCAVQIPSSLLIGSYVMETAEQREPYESRGSRTVLGEPGGESPPGHSTPAAAASHATPAVVGRVAQAAGAKRLVVSHIGLFNVDAAAAELKQAYTGLPTVGADLQC